MNDQTRRLLLDAGNSQIKLIRAHGRVLQQASQLKLNKAEISFDHAIFTDIDEIVIASVTAFDWASLFQQQTALSHIPVRTLRSPSQHPLLKNAYPQPERLGVDRWLAMLGARISCQQALCVVDLGTATTLDAVDADGQHHGGWITPGLATSRDVLHRKGHLLASAQDGNTPAFATNTADAIASGTLHSQIATIQHFLAMMQTQGMEQPRLFLTGGWAQSVQSLLSYEATLDQSLVFRGMLAQCIE